MADMSLGAGSQHGPATAVSQISAQNALALLGAVASSDVSSSCRTETGTATAGPVLKRHVATVRWALIRPRELQYAPKVPGLEDASQ